MSFTGGGLDAATTSAGIDNPMDVTINGPWDGQGAAASFTKTGAGRLTLTQGTTNHGGVAVQVQEGRLASDGPMQAASLTIVSGANVDTGLNDVAIGDGGQFRAGNLTIGSTGAPFAVGGDNMAAGPQRLTITGGTVTLRANVGASGLIAYWPFEQGSGTTAYDRSAGVHDGSIIGAAWVNDPERGWVLDFDGPDSVNVPAAGAAFSPIATTQKVSISVWQYGDPAVQPQSDTLFQGTDGGRQLSVHIPWGDRNVYWDAFGDWDRINQAASDSEFEGQWNHWVFTKDQATGTMEIYLNGAPWLSGTGKTRTFTNITSFRIGATSSGGENYDGMIDDFAVFDRVLTDTEIQAIYAGTFFRNDPINLPQTDLTVLDDATLVLDTDQSVVLGDVAMYLDTLLTIESDATSITFDTLDLLGEMHNGTYTLMELLDSEGDPRYGVFGPGMFTDVLVNGNPAGYVTLSYPEGHLVEIKVVPEPGTLTLLGLGGIGLVIRRRRNRKPR